MNEQNKNIIDIEINFCDNFSDVIVKDYGKIYLNETNKLSWDSNHAIITNLNSNIDKILDDIETEYKKREITPRIYNSFENDIIIISNLKKRKWKFENSDSSFYLHKHYTELNVIGQFEIIKVFNQELEEVILSDPDEGDWITNTIKIGLIRKNIKIIGLYENNKMIGFYACHTKNNITRIDNVYIHYEYRNKGFGKRLIGYMVKNHYENNDDKLLYLYSSNPIAKKIYEKMGFEKIKMPGDAWNAYKNQG